MNTKGTPLNKVCTQTPYAELNNNELNSLYVNEPGLYAIILGSNKPKRNALLSGFAASCFRLFDALGPTPSGKKKHMNRNPC